MIHPFTVICCVLAGGTVLYTYQSKHEVQLLDRQIEKTLVDTAALREQSRSLKAEFTLRENPERLRTFADQYLSLKPMLPTQFTTFAELDARLPAPRAMAPNFGTTDTTEEPPEKSGGAAPQNTPASDDTAMAMDELPIPPLPVPPPSMVIAANQASLVPKPAPPRPAAVPVAAPVPATTPIQARPPQPAQMPVQAQAQTSAPPPVQSGSLLGMARGGLAAPVPMPRPIPIGSTQWANGN